MATAASDAGEVLLRSAAASFSPSQRSFTVAAAQSPLSSPSSSSRRPPPLPRAATAAGGQQPLRQPRQYSQLSAAAAAADAAAASLSAPSTSAQAASPPLPADEQEEWRRLPVASLAALEAAQRQLAEQKREELRQLVGVRYRVLLETADSISCMQETGRDMARDMQEVQRTIAAMQAEQQTQTQQAAADAAAATASLSPSSSLASLLSAARLLLSAPSAVFAAVRRQDWLAAFSSLTEAKQRRAELSAALRGLHKEAAMPAPSPSPSVSSAASSASSASPLAVLASGGALSAALAQCGPLLDELPGVILSGCRRRLAAQGAVSTAECLQCLAVLCLLSEQPAGRSLSSLLSLYLDSRLAAVAQVLDCSCQALSALPQSSCTLVVEEAVVRIAQIVQRGIVQARVAFCPASAQTAASGGGLWQLCSQLLLQQLPAQQQEVQAGLGELSPALLSSLTERWLSAVSDSLAGQSTSSPATLPSLLRRLRTGRQLARVRDRLLDVLCFHQQLDGLLEGPQQGSDATATAAVTATASSRRRAEDEAKEKRRWDGDNAEAEAEQATEDGGQQQQSASLSAGLEEERRQQLQHRQREQLTEAWRALLSGSSAASAAAAGVSSLSLWDRLFASAFSLRCQELVAASFSRFRFHFTIEQAMQRWDQEQEAQGEGEREEAADGQQDRAAVMWSGSRQRAVNALVSSFSAQLRSLAADVRFLLHCPTADAVREALTLQQLRSPSDAASAQQPPAASAHLFPHDYLSLLSLPRFLDDELLPSLHRLYTVSVQQLAEQLKRRLQALEHGILAAMAAAGEEEQQREGAGEGEAERRRQQQCARLVSQAVFIGRCCSQITRQTAFLSFSRMLSQQQPGAQPEQGGGDGEAAAPLHPQPSQPQRQQPVAASPSSAPIISAALSSTARSAFRIWSRFVAASLSEEMETELQRWMDAASGSSAQLTRTALLSLSAPLPRPAASSHSPPPSAPAPPPPPAAAAASPALPFPIPCVPSPFVFRFLFSVQEAVYAQFGYTASAELLHWLLTDTASALLTLWESRGLADAQQQQEDGLSSPPSSSSPSLSSLSSLPFPAVLQLELDVRFLLSLLRTDDKEGRGRARAVLQAVGREVDSRAAAATGVSAEDCAQARRLLRAACAAAVQRSSLLLGLLAKRNPLASAPWEGDDEQRAEQSGSAAASAASLAAAVAASAAQVGCLPLAANAARLMPFSTSFFSTTSSYPQQHPAHGGSKGSSAAAASPLLGQNGSVAGLRSGLSSDSSSPSPGAGGSVSALLSGPLSVLPALPSSAAESATAMLREKGRQLLGRWGSSVAH